MPKYLKHYFYRYACILLVGLLIGWILSQLTKSTETSNNAQTNVDLSVMPHYNDPMYWLALDDSQQPFLKNATAREHQTRFIANWTQPWNAVAMNKEREREVFAATERQIIEIYRDQLNADNRLQIGENLNDVGEDRSEKINMSLAAQGGYFDPGMPIGQDWLDTMVTRIDWERLEDIQFHPQSRAIVTTNTHLRVFPTTARYYSQRRGTKGELGRSDQMLMTTIWAGTPIYILTTTLDNRFSYVFTKSIIGWIETDKLALASNEFIESIVTWDDTGEAILQTALATITRQNTVLRDPSSQQTRLVSNIGAIFPQPIPASDAIHDASVNTLLAPTTDEQGQAIWQLLELADANNNNERPWARTFPITANRERFAELTLDLVDRPYGWGGQYFLNDCSQELKFLLAGFGDWLNRNSAAQLEDIRQDDQSLLATTEARHEYLLNHAEPMTTLIYVGGHIMLYLGDDGEGHPLTYQAKASLPQSDGVPSKYLGRSLYLPLKTRYGNEGISPVNPETTRYFILGYLSDLV